MSDNKVTYEQQVEMGLVQRRNNFVQPDRRLQAVQGEVLPPVRSVPAVVDPYAGSMPTPVQNVVTYESNPITRAQAMVMKVHEVTGFLAILTGALMYMLQPYPASWHVASIFCLWLALASVEWVAVFCFLAILDYRETPAAQNRMQMSAYIGMMEREQLHRSRAMYPDQFREDK